MTDLPLTVVTGIGSFATAVLAYFLIRQAQELKKQTKLAYRPRIVPRFILSNIDNRFHIQLSNLGKGNATDINLEFSDGDNKPVGRKIQAYALLSIDVQIFNPIFKEYLPEIIDTGISFDEKFTFKIKGWYRDVNMDKIKADATYEYPPKLIE